MEHPYVPRDLQLPGFVPGFLPHTTVVGVYGLSSLLIVSLIWILSGRSSKVLKIDRWLMCWWAFTGLTHMILEGYFVFSPEFYKDKTGFYLAEVWKEYSKGDSRYAGRDSAVIAVEGITAVLGGPACLLAVYAIAKGKPYSHILQFAISLGQLYGTVVYFVTSILDGDNFAVSSYYYYAYYVVANSFWVLIPSLIALRSWKSICVASQGQDQKKTKVFSLDLVSGRRSPASHRDCIELLVKAPSMYMLVTGDPSKQPMRVYYAFLTWSYLLCLFSALYLLFSLPLVCKKAGIATYNMEWSSLELKLISCRGLKAFNFFQKLSVYSVVYLVDEELKKKEQQQKRQQRQKTPSDRQEGGNPEWNHLLRFDLRSLPHDHCDNLFLRFDLRCEGLVNRTIGEVCVPLKDLIDEFSGAVRFVSYQVRSCDGKANGVLNFSYKLIGSTKKQVKDHTQLQFPAEKVHYPKLEDDVKNSGDTQYPSMDDSCHPPPQLFSFPSPSPVATPRPQLFSFPSPSPVFEFQIQGFYGTSPTELPPYRAAHGAYSSSLLQSPGPYCSSLHGYNGFGKSGTRTDAFPLCL